ncbi:MAG: WG repeat-containing protein [Lachnospiraceae bacterium]|nr:WG repeat-containing protein [Lachnospiraceae bacterium]
MVKKKKRLLIFLTILLTGAGWFSAAVVSVMNDPHRNQNIILNQAEGFLEDELYMRAIPKYQEAADAYQTEKNPEIEKMIIAAYKQAGKLEEYYDLLEERIENKKAEAGEYMELAKVYADAGDAKNALKILKAGMRVYQDAGMEALYEQLRYGIKTAESNIEEMKQPQSNGYIPFFDGTKWGYADTKARLVLEAGYEEALAFSEKYAVVKLDGIYTLIDGSGDWYAVDKLGLDKVTGHAGTRITAEKNGQFGIYSNTFTEITGAVYEDAIISENGLCFVKKHGKWGIADGNGTMITDFLYDEVVLNSHAEAFASGRAVVRDQTGYFIINEKGEALNDFRYENAKGAEGGWIAVTDKTGKWGFTDGIKEQVIPCQYEDAYSMSCEVAPVKYAGKWGYISKKNEFAINPEFEQAMPFFEGSAIVKKMGYCEIMTFLY